MKKLILLVGVAVAAFLTSCNKHVAKDVDLENKQDSVSYAYGFAVGNQISMYNLQSDSLYKANPQKVVETIVEEFCSAYKADEDVNEYFVIGQNLGRSMRQLRKEGLMNGQIEFNEKALKAGLVNQMIDENEYFTWQEADEYMNQQFRQIRERQNRATIQQLPPEIPDSIEQAIDSQKMEDIQLEEVQIAE